MKRSNHLFATAACLATAVSALLGSSAANAATACADLAKLALPDPLVATLRKPR